MRPSNHPSPPATGSSFRCNKSLGTIKHKRRWHRDGLIQLALDVAIDAIGHADKDQWPEENQRLPLLVKSNGHPLIIHLTEDEWREPRSLAKFDTPEILLMKGYVQNEPRLSNARSIWRYNKLKIPIVQKLRLLEKFHISGGVLTIFDLASSSACAEIQISQAFRLVCDGILTVDLDQPFLASTAIRVNDPNDEKTLKS